MSLGDAGRVQNQIDYQGGLAQNRLNNLRDSLVPQNQGLQNRFNVAADRGITDYNNILGGYGSYMDQARSPYTFGALPGYQSFGSGGRDASLDPMGLNAVSSAMGGYQNFANTGGYNPGDIASMRARSQGALRSAYDTAQRDISREGRLRGGNSPNQVAAIAKLTRDQAQGLSDANINLEATLADQIRQGKLAGLSGLAGTGASQQGLGLSRDSLNNQSRLSGLAGQTGINAAQLSSILSGLQGMTSAYSATPGQANMYGQLLGQSNSQLLNTEQLQNALAQMIMQAQLGKSQVPSNFNQVMGNIGSVLGLGGQVAGALTGLGSGGGVSGLPGGTRGPF